MYVYVYVNIFNIFIYIYTHIVLYIYIYIHTYIYMPLSSAFTMPRIGRLAQNAPPLFVRSPQQQPLPGAAVAILSRRNFRQNHGVVGNRQSTDLFKGTCRKPWICKNSTIFNSVPSRGFQRSHSKTSARYAARRFRRRLHRS